MSGQECDGAPGTSKRLVLEDESGGGQHIENARPHGHNAGGDLGQVVEGPEGDEAVGGGRQCGDRRRVDGRGVAQEAARQPH